jgi:amino acid adenylation domain-containing protein
MGNAVDLNEPREVGVASPSGGQTIPKLSEGDPAPLSFAQEQLWLHEQLVPEIPIYNEPVTIRREGTLDVPTLARVLSEIVRRHESWRTIFKLIDGEPVQVIQPATPVHLPFVDLSGIPESQREAESHQLAYRDALRPFELSRGPLFRPLLVSFSETEHKLYLTLHHIIFDGYSIYRVLLPELTALYSAFSEGKASPLPEPSIQYSDFVRGERDRHSRQDRLQSQLAYWRAQLGGGLPVLQLASDHPRPAKQSFCGATHPVMIRKDLSDALKLLSQREGVTLFMTLLAVFAALLHRYSSLEDMAIGTVSSGRKRSELEGLLGYFLNPIVLRNDLSGNPTFREVLRRTRNVVLDALSNDDAPFTHVVNDLHPDRSLSFNPLFQVLLTLEPPFAETRDGWTVALTQSEVDTGFVKFDLCLELDDRPSGIVGRFKYSTDLFQVDTVSRMAGHLTTLLRGVVANPNRRISELPILTDHERQQICVEWNSTSAEFPADRCLHELFQQQAKQRPEISAVIDGRGQRSYDDLERKSNQLARHLRAHGLTSEAPVGLYFEPSYEMIVGILGVLKAGGVCVPLDPSYPVDRIADILHDTQLRILLTQRPLSPPLPRWPVQVLYLDTGWDEIEREAGEPVDSGCRPENLAYLFYTSGSTGKPKGVQVTHRNLVHSTHARSLYYGNDAGRFLLLSSFAFDSSLAGIFGSLCRGGTLVMTPGPLQQNLTQLAKLVAQHGVTELLCVPSLYSLLLDQAQDGVLASLRTVIVAGESCPAELVQRHHELLPLATLFNEYGPTEAAVWSTVYKCEPGYSGSLVPIGRQIPNVQAYVLDSHLNLVPVGVPGQLCIGGAGVARGYLNRPEETAERFVTAPFHDKPGSRLYATGDLVRYLPDGNLELLGRLDHQVKIRGFRIELEEIEAVIAEYPGVRQAVVTYNADGTSRPKLTAYVVSNDRARFDEERLRRFLSGRLPEAMLPGGYVVLDALPLTPNGKIDRQALPAVSTAKPTKEFVPSNSVLEGKLAEIWESVLDRREIGVTDNFFDLGGHSLLVAKLLLRIEQRFAKKLSLGNVFQAPTIRQLAALLDEQTQPKHSPAIVPIQPHGSRPPLFWVRGGPLFLDLANRLGPDQPFFGLDLPVSDASRLPVPYRLEDIAAAYVVRLREVQPEGPYYLAGLCVNAVIAYEMARILALQGQEVALLVMVDGQNPAYYLDFSHESRWQLLSRKLQFHMGKLRRGRLRGVPGFLAGRTTGIGLRFSVARWRIYHKLGWRVSDKHLQADLDTIVHPASYHYRPGPYPGHIVFVQSTDWPACRYYDFHASWDGLVAGGMEVHKIPGGHLSMFYEENIDELAGKLQVCLAAARDSYRSKRPFSTAIKAAKPAAPRFREARLEDYPKVSVLESRYGLNPKSYEEWADLWLANPLYRKIADWPIGWVCENRDGEIVGSVANIPLAYQMEGRSLVAATSRSLVMDSPYRPYSFSLLSRFFQQKQVDLFVNTTVNPKAAKLQELFHAQRVPAGAWDRCAFWITNYRAFIASLMARKEMPGVAGLSYPLSAGLFLGDRLMGPALRVRRNGVRPQFHTEFDERFDEFWERLQAGRVQELLAIRSREVLHWHFRHALSRNKAWILTADKGDKLAAYAIFLRQDNLSYGLHRMRLIDFQALPGENALLRPILLHALERCHQEGIHMLEAIGLSGDKQRVLESMSPHYRELGSWRYFYRANDPRLAETLKNPEIWDPTCFDGDSSL